MSDNALLDSSEDFGALQEAGFSLLCLAVHNRLDYIIHVNVLNVV